MRSGGGAIAPSALAFDQLTLTAIFSFAAPLPDGDYTATLKASGFTDLTGQRLAADYSLGFFTLIGDANRDRSVDFADLLILAQNYGASGLDFDGGNFDYDPDGNVDFADLLLLAQRYGSSAHRSIAAPARRPARTASPRPLEQIALS
jgi:hypothetical protein